MALDARLAHLLLKDEICEFLYAEADLLDHQRWEDWLALLAEDVHYSMPLQLNVSHDRRDRASTVAGHEVCWFDEDRETLLKRVDQLRTGVHWAEEPLSRVSHFVSNIRLVEVDGEPDAPSAVTVGCRFLVYRNRVAAETDVFAGRRTDRLRRAGDSWLIARRELVLDQNVLQAKNLTVLF